ncbi:replication initiator, partial [Planobispora takensis]|uniref:replication initiator n=2 Tax=Planobispora takensis TaxID=1367882 RepID=UPI0035EBD282
DRSTPRAIRLSMPLAREVVDQLAVSLGVCIRPIPMYRLDPATGQSRCVDVPCGTTLESKCPPCAKRNLQLRKAQCREGWHAETEPEITLNAPTEEQSYLIELRAQLQGYRDQAEADGEDLASWDEAITEAEAQMRAAGLRGSVLGRSATSRQRSTRRRQDAPDLPKRKKIPGTLGRLYESPDGRRYRPSMFITLTLPSYGKVRDGAPIDPDAYDYTRAVRDAIHFGRLVDRFIQNLRRVAGWEVQYFATVEPQKRGAPHLHLAMRGTLSRAEIKQIAAATYHQVWWPATDRIVFDGEHLPVWEDGCGYLDPRTGEVLPTWDEALDAIDEDAEPLHVLRFGEQVKPIGVLGGTERADHLVKHYLTKYLTKSIAETCAPETQPQKDHADRMVAALHYEPCSEFCPNWLRYGVQPKNARAGQAPGRCAGKAHKAEHLGIRGRRVLVSRKWSTKTLTDHRADRRAWVLETLGLSATESPDPNRYVWRKVPSGDPDLPPLGQRLLSAIAERQRQRELLAEAQARQDDTELSATGKEVAA